MCWGTGAFLAAGILRGTLDLPGDGPWKIPYGLQWIWPVPLFLIAWLAPESTSFGTTDVTRQEASADVQVRFILSARTGSRRLEQSFARLLVLAIVQNE